MRRYLPATVRMSVSWLWKTCKRLQRVPNVFPSPSVHQSNALYCCQREPASSHCEIDWELTYSQSAHAAPQVSQPFRLPAQKLALLFNYPPTRECVKYQRLNDIHCSSFRVTQQSLTGICPILRHSQETISESAEYHEEAVSESSTFGAPTHRTSSPFALPCCS